MKFEQNWLSGSEEKLFENVKGRMDNGLRTKSDHNSSS